MSPAPASNITTLPTPKPASGPATPPDAGGVTEEEDGRSSWPDDAAESSYLAEARERGEPLAKAGPVEGADDADPKSLPALDELVQRIPADVRDVLDDLFRAKFTKVRRIPLRALKD